jgi:hypothetical protein
MGSKEHSVVAIAADNFRVARQNEAACAADASLVSWQNEQHPVSKNNVSPLKSGGREGIRTPGLLIANEEILKLRRVATIS